MNLKLLGSLARLLHASMVVNQKFSLFAVFLAFLAVAGRAHALPFLQLDIQGGTWVSSDQTTYPAGQVFSVYALMNQPTATELDHTYYLSIAVYPNQPRNPVPNIGSFSVNGVSYTAANMVWGIPPVDEQEDINEEEYKDLAPHSVFPTYYLELDFKFSPDARLNEYNVQTQPYDPVSRISSAGNMYYHAFNVNMQGLLAGYSLHFDLYRPVSSTSIIKAPFSHDAQSLPGTNVPEAGSTVVLLGLGLLALAAAREVWHRRFAHLRE